MCIQQYKDNNGDVKAPQSYVVRTLPTLLGLMVIIQIIMRNVCIYERFLYYQHLQRPNDLCIQFSQLM